MKKISFICSLFMLIGLIANAQDSTSVSVDVTEKDESSITAPSLLPHFGFKLSTLSPDPAQANTNLGYGYHFGLSYVTGGRIFFQPGFEWSRYNFPIEVTDSNSYKQQNKINTVRVPLLFGINFIDPEGHDNDIFNLRFLTGPSVTFLTGVVAPNDELLVQEDDFQPVSLSYNIGLGFKILMFYTDIGYEYGITNILTGTDFNSKNRTLYIDLGVHFKL